MNQLFLFAVLTNLAAIPCHALRLSTESKRGVVSAEVIAYRSKLFGVRQSAGQGYSSSVSIPIEVEADRNAMDTISDDEDLDMLIQNSVSYDSRVAERAEGVIAGHGNSSSASARVEGEVDRNAAEMISDEELDMLIQDSLSYDSRVVERAEGDSVTLARNRSGMKQALTDLHNFYGNTKLDEVAIDVANEEQKRKVKDEFVQLSSQRIFKQGFCCLGEIIIMVLQVRPLTQPVLDRVTELVSDRNAKIIQSKVDEFIRSTKSDLHRPVKTILRLRFRTLLTEIVEKVPNSRLQGMLGKIVPFVVKFATSQTISHVLSFFKMVLTKACGGSYLS